MSTTNLKEAVREKYGQAACTRQSVNEIVYSKESECVETAPAQIAIAAKQKQWLFLHIFIIYLETLFAWTAPNLLQLKGFTLTHATGIRVG